MLCSIWLKHLDLLSKAWPFYLGELRNNLLIPLIPCACHPSTPKYSSSSPPSLCRTRSATSMQEGDPEAADLSTVGQASLQHPDKQHRIVSIGYRYQPIHSSSKDQPPPDTATAAPSRLFSLEACRNVTSASSRKLNHNASRG